MTRFLFFLLMTVIISAFSISCTVYYQPHGKHKGGVVIKVPEDPEVRPMPKETAPKNVPIKKSYPQGK